MNPFAMFGVGGLMAVSLLFLGMYQMSNVVGNVTYEKSSNTQTASVVVTNVPSLERSETEKKQEKVKEEDTEPVKEPEESIGEGIEPEEELIAAVPEAPEPNEPEPTSVSVEVGSGQSDTIADLQEQVNSLLEQVSEATSAQTSSNEDSEYFITPNGVKIDANGNVVNENQENDSTETSSTETTSQKTEITLPHGYYKLPTGVIMGPGGVIVDEDDLTDAQQAQEISQQTKSLDCFALPNGNLINAYGQPCDE